jgi:hypothetical protein
MVIASTCYAVNIPTAAAPCRAGGAGCRRPEVVGQGQGLAEGHGRNRAV